jgi:hypothetical protein
MVTHNAKLSATILADLSLVKKSPGCLATGTAIPVGLTGAAGNLLSAPATSLRASRGVSSLHADRTMAVTDSGQGGPTFFFSSPTRLVAPDGNGGLVARTIDFDFPPSADVARLDYTISFQNGGNQITGTIALTTFPLQGNPLDGGGTVDGTFTFTGDLIEP